MLPHHTTVAKMHTPAQVVGQHVLQINDPGACASGMGLDKPADLAGSGDFTRSQPDRLVAPVATTKLL